MGTALPPWRLRKTSYSSEVSRRRTWLDSASWQLWKKSFKQSLLRLAMAWKIISFTAVEFLSGERRQTGLLMATLETSELLLLDEPLLQPWIPKPVRRSLIVTNEFVARCPHSSYDHPPWKCFWNMEIAWCREDRTHRPKISIKEKKPNDHRRLLSIIWRKIRYKARKMQSENRE